MSSLTHRRGDPPRDGFLQEDDHGSDAHAGGGSPGGRQDVERERLGASPGRAVLSLAALDRTDRFTMPLASMWLLRAAFGWACPPWWPQALGCGWPAGAVAGTEGAALLGWGGSPAAVLERWSVARACGGAPEPRLRERPSCGQCVAGAGGRGRWFGAGGRGPGRWWPMVRGVRRGSRAVTAAGLVRLRT